MVYIKGERRRNGKRTENIENEENNAEDLSGLDLGTATDNLLTGDQS